MKLRLVSIKFIKRLLAIGLFIALMTLSSCFNFELFPEKTIVFEGKVVEAFNATKPIDSVLVQGCTQEMSLFPNWPSCDTETLTDNDGHFHFSLKANDLTGRQISYRKEGYRSLDSCITLSNGRMECYMEPLPTVFYIYSPTKNAPFEYDSLRILVSTIDRDTVVHYTINSFINTQGGTSYYWTDKEEPDNLWDRSYTNIYVPDNSHVKLEAHYFKSEELKTIDFDTLFCTKGVGNKYKILDK